MSEMITNQLSCLEDALSVKFDELISTVQSSSSADYTDLLNTIVVSLQNLEANTDDVEAQLTNISTNTATAVTQLTDILSQVSDINENTDQVEEMLTKIIDILSSMLNKEVFAFVAQGDVCASVDGESQYVTPYIQFNTTTGVEVGVTYRDRMGVAITGVVSAADPCDCKCLDCDETVNVVDNAFDLTEFLSSNPAPENTKFAFDTPTFDKAHGDAGTAAWTASSLVASLNTASPNATAAENNSGIDYTSTVFAVHPTISTAIVVSSGPVPTTLDLVSLSVSLPVVSI